MKFMYFIQAGKRVIVMIKNCRNCKHLGQTDEYIDIWDDGGEFIAKLYCMAGEDVYIDEPVSECESWEKYTDYEFEEVE